jgi:lipoprotein-releasing system permease protein
MWFLALRHLLTRPQQTILTFVGLIIGASGYIIITGLQLGYHDYIVDRLINTDGHVRISPRDDYVTEKTFTDIFFTDSSVKWITPPSGRIFNSNLTNVQGWFDRLEHDPDVDSFSPQFIRNVILSKGKFSLPARFIGMDSTKQSIVTNLENDIIEGTLGSVNQGDSLIVIGDELMKKLGAKLNDTVNVVIPDGSVFPLKITGVFRTGVKQIDAYFTYSSNATVQKITRAPGEYSDIIVKLKNVESAQEIASEWGKISPDKVESWDQANENVLIVVNIQRIVKDIMSFIIIMIVAFGIYNILNMVVNQKKREIAILRSVGFDNKDTIMLFMYQGLIFAVVGSIAGIIVGYFGSIYMETVKVNAADGHLMIRWDIWIYIKAFLLISISSVFASFIPARTAGRLSPIEIIRGST